MGAATQTFAPGGKYPGAATAGSPPQPKSNLVHFSLKVWHLVATILIIFLRKLSKFHVSETVNANPNQNWSQCQCHPAMKGIQVFGCRSLYWKLLEAGWLCSYSEAKTAKTLPLNAARVGAEGVRFGEGVSCFPMGRDLEIGLCLLPRIFFICEFKMVRFGAFLVLFFTVRLPVLHAK